MGPKQPICPEQNFLVLTIVKYLIIKSKFLTIVITFIYLLALFIAQNFKKFLQRIQNYDNAPFLAQSGPFAPQIFFSENDITIILIYLLAPFIVQNFKKILAADPEL